MKGKKSIKILLVVLAVVAAGVIYSCVARAKPAGAEPETQVQTETEAAQTEASVRMVCVHVCGAVVTPGVYYLEEGSRIHEAVDMAGGLREDAAEEYINLAQILSDGQQVYIPDTEEVLAGAVQAPYEADDGLVNINTASAAELKSIPGIGDTKAEAIISYRENISAFNSIEDIKNVAGIKDSLYEKIKDYIKV